MSWVRPRTTSCPFLSVRLVEQNAQLLYLHFNDLVHEMVTRSVLDELDEPRKHLTSQVASPRLAGDVPVLKRVANCNAHGVLKGVPTLIEDLLVLALAHQQLDILAARLPDHHLGGSSSKGGEL